METRQVKMLRLNVWLYDGRSKLFKKYGSKLRLRNHKSPKEQSRDIDKNTYSVLNTGKERRISKIAMQVDKLNFRQPTRVSISPFRPNPRRVLFELTLEVHLGILYPVQDFGRAVFVQLVVFPLKVFGLVVHKVDLPSVVAGSVLGVPRRSFGQCQAHRYDYY